MLQNNIEKNCSLLRERKRVPDILYFPSTNIKDTKMTPNQNYNNLVRQVLFNGNTEDRGMMLMVLLSCRCYIQLKENSTQLFIAK